MLVRVLAGVLACALGLGCGAGGGRLGEAALVSGPPRGAEAHRLSAEAEEHAKAKRWPEAVAALEKAHAANPRDEAITVRLKLARGRLSNPTPEAWLRLTEEVARDHSWVELAARARARARRELIAWLVDEARTAIDRRNAARAFTLVERLGDLDRGTVDAEPFLVNVSRTARELADARERDGAGDSFSAALHYMRAAEWGEVFGVDVGSEAEQAFARASGPLRALARARKLRQSDPIGAVRAYRGLSTSVPLALELEVEEVVQAAVARAGEIAGERACSAGRSPDEAIGALWEVCGLPKTEGARFAKISVADPAAALERAREQLGSRCSGAMTWAEAIVHCRARVLLGRTQRNAQRDPAAAMAVLDRLVPLEGALGSFADLRGEIQVAAALRAAARARSEAATGHAERAFATYRTAATSIRHEPAGRAADLALSGDWLGARAELASSGADAFSVAGLEIIDRAVAQTLRSGHGRELARLAAGLLAQDPEHRAARAALERLGVDLRRASGDFDRFREALASMAVVDSNPESLHGALEELERGEVSAALESLRALDAGASVAAGTAATVLETWLRKRVPVSAARVRRAREAFQQALEALNGEEGLARSSFVEAAALDPNLFPAWFNAAVLAERQGDHQAAALLYGEVAARPAAGRLARAAIGARDQANLYAARASDPEWLESEDRRQRLAAVWGAQGAGDERALEAAISRIEGEAGAAVRLMVAATLLSEGRADACRWLPGDPSSLEALPAALAVAGRCGQAGSVRSGLAEAEAAKAAGDLGRAARALEQTARGARAPRDLLVQALSLYRRSGDPRSAARLLRVLAAGEGTVEGGLAREEAESLDDFANAVDAASARRAPAEPYLQLDMSIVAELRATLQKIAEVEQQAKEAVAEAARRTAKRRSRIAELERKIDDALESADRYEENADTLDRQAEQTRKSMETAASAGALDGLAIGLGSAAYGVGKGGADYMRRQAEEAREEASEMQEELRELRSEQAEEDAVGGGAIDGSD